MTNFIEVDKVTNVAGKQTVYSSGGHIVDFAVATYEEQALIYGGTGNGTMFQQLSLTITPKKSTNIIIASWMINGESHWNKVFRVFRNGSLITTTNEQGYNNESGNVEWSGIISGWYDNNYASTPNSFKLMYQQVANTTSQITLTPAIKDAGGTDQWFYLNRTQASTGAESYEQMVSTGYLFEISA